MKIIYSVLIIFFLASCTNGVDKIESDSKSDEKKSSEVLSDR